VAKSLEGVFGAVLQELRRQAGVSQEQLGFASGHHRTYIGLLERGLRAPTLNTIFQLAMALNLSPSEIVRRVELRRESGGVSNQP
jgi:transcriptional regulator with XRE-family HTH domain